MLHYQVYTTASTEVTVEPVSSMIIKNRKTSPSSFLCSYILALHPKTPLQIFTPGASAESHNPDGAYNEANRKGPLSEIRAKPCSDAGPLLQTEGTITHTSFCASF